MQLNILRNLIRNSRKTILKKSQAMRTFLNHHTNRKKINDNTKQSSREIRTAREADIEAFQPYELKNT